jgi:DNA-binding LacI/PurR family transcriptional regulator
VLGWEAVVTGIRDLARHLDISIGTVSRALNDKPDVNPLTRARVREAASRLGYSPNQSGRSLRRGKTDLVGVIIPTGQDSALINTVFMSVLDGLRRKLSERRLDLAIFLHAPDRACPRRRIDHRRNAAARPAHRVSHR